MKLNKVIINNFRNVAHAEYSLANRNVFCGPNKMGKTNTISAIYWALTGYQIDGSSDSMKNKPFADTKLEVAVELQFDEFSMKRTYQEKWTKTRGSNELVMEGHEQKIYVDDVKYTIKNGEAKIKALLGLDISLSTSKFDLLRCLIDPYYIVNMSSQNNWKILREFIVELVGDVTREDVFNELYISEASKDFMESKKFDTAICSKFLKDQIKNLKDEIKATEAKIQGFKESFIQPALNERLEAQKQYIILENQIEDIRVAQRSYVNPVVRKLEDELEQTRDELMKSQTADAAAIQNYNGTIDTQINHVQEELDNLLPAFNQHRNSKNNLESRLFEKQSELRRMKIDCETLEVQRSLKLKEYHEWNNKEFVVPPIMEQVVCPECGCVLNANDLVNEQKRVEDARNTFEMEKKYTLEGIVKLGTEMRNKIDNLMFGIEDAEKEVYQMQEELSKSVDQFVEVDKKIKQLESEMATLRAKRRTGLANDSEKTTSLKRRIYELQKEIENAKLVRSDEQYDVQILELKQRMEEYNKVLEQERDYQRAQEKVHEYEHLVQQHGDKLCEYEQLLIDVEEYIKKKLELLDSNVKSVFGERLKFVLVEANIKEGSFNEVCKPTVLDKNTMLIDGSGAEKIQAGIYIIECIKSKLGLVDLPIIFDEADKLDSVSITKLYTNSQIISTKVDDINYSDVTLVTN